MALLNFIQISRHNFWIYSWQLNDRQSKHEAHSRGATNTNNVFSNFSNKREWDTILKHAHRRENECPEETNYRRSIMVNRQPSNQLTEPTLTNWFLPSKTKSSFNHWNTKQEFILFISAILCFNSSITTTANNNKQQKNDDFDWRLQKFWHPNNIQ